MPPAFHALRASIPAVALLLLITLPFAGRAHHVDDPLYLEAARQVLTAPLDPLSGLSFWHERPATLFDDLYNPPLTAYLMALPLAAGRGGEVPIHLAMILLAAASLGAVSWTGEALGVPARWSILLAASPALCASAVSAMADVPFLLLTVLAWGTAARGRAGASGVLIALSALTKYVGLVNVPLSVLALRPPSKRKAALLTAVAGGLFVAWCVFNLIAYGQLHVSAASRFGLFAFRRQGELLLSLVAALGVAGLPAAVGLIRWTRAVAALSAVAGAAGAALVLARGGGPANAVIGFVAFAAGAALFLAAWRATRAAGRGDLFLPACFWGYATYTGLLVYFGAARYLLPLLPPLVWLLARHGDGERSRTRWLASIGAGAVLSVLVLWGDAGYANAWRTAAGRLPREGRRFEIGHWGFQWYAGAVGYTPLEPRQVLGPGDVVAEAQGIHGARTSPAHAALLHELSLVTVPSPWVRVMDRRAQAGLYSSAWGFLPFGLRWRAAEVVRLATPAPWLLAASAYPPASPVCVDLGTPEGRHVLLDGWSGDEAFSEAGVRTTFVWGTGPDSALWLPLPPGIDRVRLRAAPFENAVGRMRIALGPSASAVFDLQPGWRIYEAPVEGTVAGGLTTVVLWPPGVRRTAALGREDRPLSVAVDAIAFGAGDLGESRGVWPVATDAGPGVWVATSAASLFEGPGARVRGRIRVESGTASLTWGDAGEKVWAGDHAACASGCAFDVAVPPGSGRLVVRADRAIVTGVEAAQAPP